MTDTRQIERLRFNLRAFRQYALKALDEMESQIDELAGAEPKDNGGDWKKVWQEYEAQK